MGWPAYVPAPARGRAHVTWPATPQCPLSTPAWTVDCARALHKSKWSLFVPKEKVRDCSPVSPDGVAPPRFAKSARRRHTCPPSFAYRPWAEWGAPILRSLRATNTPQNMRRTNGPYSVFLYFGQYFSSLFLIPAGLVFNLKIITN